MKAPIKLGPLALLLSVISICLTTLAILSFSTASADLRLAEKYAETVTARYALEAEGQKYLRDVSLGRADGETDEDGVLWKKLERGGAVLTVGVDPEGRIVSWRQQMEWNQDTVIGDLWLGN